MSLEIRQVEFEAIQREGEKAYPNECCGFLLGKAGSGGKQVSTVLPAQNQRGDTDRHNRFLISPEEFLFGEKSARAQGLDIVGIYHSHPNAEARPSQFDLEHSWPWYSYVIVSVKEGKARELNSWVLEDDRSLFDQEKVLVTE